MVRWDQYRVKEREHFHISIESYQNKPNLQVWAWLRPNGVEQKKWEPESFACEDAPDISEVINVFEEANESIEFCGLTFKISADTKSVDFVRYNEQVTPRHEEHKANIERYLEMIKSADLRQKRDDGVIVFADD